MLYLIQALHCEKDSVENSRVFGVFTEDQLDEARNIIRNNVTDLWESYYKYIAIVRIPENTLYVTIYSRLFELYEVNIPEHSQDSSTKDWIDKVKFDLIETEKIPEFIKKCWTSTDLE